MRLDILPIREISGEAINFDYLLDLSSLELYAERPIPEPVRVHGFAKNRADMFELDMDIDFTVVTRCARCLKPLEVPVTLKTCRPMADSVENMESDDGDEILILDNNQVDLDEIATEAIVLEAEMSYLCREDCAGLCYVCGADLNEGSCNCKKETDGRFDALASLLKREDK